jgi:hypothetical protein
MIIMRSTQLKSHAIWQWTIETQIEEVDTTKVMSQTWLKFEDWIMNAYDKCDALTKQWNQLKKIKQIRSFKTFQLQFQNAIWNMNEHSNDAILNLMLINRLKSKLRSEWYMKMTKFINFHKVCRILKRLDIEIKAVRQVVETDQSNLQSSNQDFSATSKTTIKKENAMNLNMLLLHFNVTWLNEIYKIKLTSSKSSSGWQDWCQVHKACFKCGSIKHEKKQCDKSKSTSTKN